MKVQQKKQNQIKITLLSTIALTIVPVLVFLVIFNYIDEGPFAHIEGISTTSVTQEINSANPIDYSEILSSIDDTVNAILNYKIILPLDDGEVTEEPLPQVVASPILTFVGQVAFPYSTVLLSVNSDPFFISLKSDAHGYQSWTNFGQPLEQGQHALTVYNISTSGIDKKDVLVNQYAFIVQSIESEDPPPELVFSDNNGKQQVVDDFLMWDFASDGPEPYVFLSELKDSNKEVYPGSTLDILFSLQPLQEGQSEEVTFYHELYPVNTAQQTNPIISFYDETITESTLYKKIIYLKKDAPTGTYVLKTEAVIGDQTYIQNFSFDIVKSPLITVTGEVVDKENITQAIVWNIIFFLFIILIVLVVVIFEYRRFFINQPIDEDNLRQGGFIK